jgi:hypothetical protein
VHHQQRRHARLLNNTWSCSRSAANFLAGFKNLFLIQFSLQCLLLTSPATMNYIRQTIRVPIVLQEQAHLITALCCHNEQFFCVYSSVLTVLNCFYLFFYSIFMLQISRLNIIELCILKTIAIPAHNISRVQATHTHALLFNDNNRELMVGSLVLKKFSKYIFRNFICFSLLLARVPLSCHS